MNWLRGLSIRWRITIGSVVVGAALLFAAGLVVQAQVQQAQINSDKKLLYGATTPFIAQVRDRPQQIDQPAGEERLVIFNPAGRAVASNLPDDLTGHQAKLRALGTASHFFSIDGVDYLAVVRIVATPQGDWHIVAVRDQSNSTNIVLANITNVILIGGGALLIGIGVASWVLTTLALRPVALMRTRAESLHGLQSDELLPVGPARDELSDLATTLNAFLERMRASVAREKQMVADASHDLRTPIAVAQASLELAQRSGRDMGSVLHDVSVAHESVQRLSRIATNLLTLSGLDADQTVRSSPWSELVGEFTSAFDRAQVIAADRGLRIDFDVSEPEGAERYAVPAADFGRVIDNIVRNAITAAPDGSAIGATLVRERGELVLRVVDDGPGMPPEFIATATERFSRPDAARSRAAGGAGLGLAIVAAIAGRGGGTVAIANRSEGGLEVVVRVPAQP